MAKTIPAVNHANSQEEAARRIRMLEKELTENRLQLELRQKDIEKLHAVMELARDAVILMLPDGSVASWNRAAEEMFGYTMSEAFGRKWHELVMPAHYHQAYREALPCIKPLDKGRAIGRVVELTARHKNGSEFSIELSLNSIHIDDQTITAGIVRDITERNTIQIELKRANEKLNKLTMIDGLTGLANKQCLKQWLDGEWQRACHSHMPISIILCGIDCFKHYNDAYGHHAGAACLRTVAQIIQSCVQKPTDLVAQYNGDEFMVVLSDMDLASAKSLAESLRCRVAQNEIPHTESPVAPHITISAGVVSVFPDRTLTPEKVISTVHTALYKAKKQGQNCVAVGELDIESHEKPAGGLSPAHSSVHAMIKAPNRRYPCGVNAKPNSGMDTGAARVQQGGRLVACSGTRPKQTQT